jgi:hypothetical protein
MHPCYGKNALRFNTTQEVAMRRLALTILVGLVAIIPLGTSAAVFDGAVFVMTNSTDPAQTPLPDYRINAVVRVDLAGDVAAHGTLLERDAEAGRTVVHHILSDGAMVIGSETEILELSLRSRSGGEQRELLILITPRIPPSDSGKYPAMAAVFDSDGNLVAEFEIVLQVAVVAPLGDRR